MKVEVQETQINKKLLVEYKGNFMALNYIMSETKVNKIPK
jgi:hypothetical protein